MELKIKNLRPVTCGIIFVQKYKMVDRKSPILMELRCKIGMLSSCLCQFDFDTVLGN